MAFFPDVQRGEEFKPNAQLSNAVRHMVNALDGFAAKPVITKTGMVRIQVYNGSGRTLAAGTAVNFDDDAEMCDDAIPAIVLQDTGKPWGVLVTELKEQAIGSCILSGPARVTLSGTGDYAAPTTSNPAVFVRGATGAPVIYASENKGMILLGAVAQDIYDGPFALSYDTEKKKLKVKYGYANLNGEWQSVSAAELAPENGMVCVCAAIGDDGKWTAPEVKITSPGLYAYPVGSCKVSGESVTVCSFRIPVAILLAVDICSTTN